MPPLGFEPTISAGERPQTYSLDRAATGTGMAYVWGCQMWYVGRLRVHLHCLCEIFFMSERAQYFGRGGYMYYGYI